MKFKFKYTEWQEDEGFEIEMIPTFLNLEKHDMQQEEGFAAFMKGYFDYILFIRSLSKLAYIERLEKRLEQAKQNGEQEVVFYVEEQNDSEEKAWKYFINQNETRFLNPIDNELNPEHFQNTAIPTELFLALLKEWKIYLASGSQEEKIVDIPFEYDKECFRKTGKIQRQRKN